MLAIKSLRSSSLIPFEMINLALLTFSLVKKRRPYIKENVGRIPDSAF